MLNTLISTARAAFATSDASTATQEFAPRVEQALLQRTDRHMPRAMLFAVAEACRPTLAQRWAATQAIDAARKNRRVHYLSMEFLMGRALHNAVTALGVEGELHALAGKGILADWETLMDGERDAALGNGGLGRLAACFLDAMAAREVPAFGYGLRYRYGMFSQRIESGRQTERADDWLRDGSPWELFRDEVTYTVPFGGRVESELGRRVWHGAAHVNARAVDFIVPAHDSERVATLRLWQAEANEPIDYAAFCRGDYPGAAAGAHEAEVLNWVLYPDDSTAAGRTLRLKQEYFLVSASIQDMIARHLAEGRDLVHFGRDNCVHLNDTHPALAPAELMRLLIDTHGLAWEDAWRITTEATSYTNHTLMPEALETWPVHLMAEWLPRHLEIIYGINQRFLDALRETHGADEDRVRALSLIEEGPERRVRMAHLAIVASHKVNGVSALHSNLMTETIFAGFAALTPEKFVNVTNGITHRRWLMQANPALAAAIDGALGGDWRRTPARLGALADKAQDAGLMRAVRQIKRDNKKRLAEIIRQRTGILVTPESLFDVQVKRIHEYKRQLLNVLHVVAQYLAIADRGEMPAVARTVVIAGKAASAYRTAKLIIQLIHDVAREVNSDPRVADQLKLVFLPDYGVSLAERIMPAADLSEQISTAGTEASGTGNMKFALNGALTIGTWDGANIEMAEAMGPENMFVFGLKADEVAALRGVGYDPRLHAEQDRELAAVLNAIGNGRFSPEEPQRYRALVDHLLGADPYFLLADFAGYMHAQREADALYLDSDAWTTRAIRNIAAMGVFSADRSIDDYQRLIWQRGESRSV
ncbi:MAG: glycogen/starch/alpha-glucan phosphorylase [Betaproteobacteria bacterium]|nr:glycogen/starch/alpha-glucan phosphorylase [Betaproteobacteria bacterium]